MEKGELERVNVNLNLFPCYRRDCFGPASSSSAKRRRGFETSNLLLHTGASIGALPPSRTYVGASARVNDQGHGLAS